MFKITILTRFRHLRTFQSGKNFPHSFVHRWRVAGLLQKRKFLVLVWALDRFVDLSNLVHWNQRARKEKKMKLSVLCPFKSKFHIKKRFWLHSPVHTIEIKDLLDWNGMHSLTNLLLVVNKIVLGKPHLSNCIRREFLKKQKVNFSNLLIGWR